MTAENDRQEIAARLPTGLTAFILLVLAFPLIALIDVLRSEFKGNNKLIWVIVIVFFNFIGAFLYLLIGIRQKAKHPAS